MEQYIDKLENLIDEKKSFRFTKAELDSLEATIREHERHTVKNQLLYPFNTHDSYKNIDQLREAIERIA